MARKPRGDGSNRTNRLLNTLERIERLEDERRELATQIADVKKEAKAAGFDTKVLGQMLRERRMSEVDRAEWQALCETYRAALGMLGGTPLGEAARRRFSGETRPTPPGQAGDGDADAAEGAEGVESAQSEPTIGPEDIDAARRAGAVAFTTKTKITENPHAFDDPRRAAWDEGWCKEAGSDGMDLPDAWRRAKPPKGDGKSDGKGDGKGGTA